MNILLENVTEQRDRWLELKKKTIGSSEIATALGLNPFRSPLDLFLEKTGRSTGFEGNDATDLGNYMEPWILSKYAAKEKITLKRPDVLVGHDTEQWATATPDGFIMSTVDVRSIDSFNIEQVIGPEAVCEAKNVSHRMMHHWYEETVPDYAHAQCAWQTSICKLEYGVVAAMLGGDGKSIFSARFPNDPDLMDQMLNGGRVFMEAVRTDTAPSARAGDVHAVENMYKRLSGKIVELNEMKAYVLAAEYEKKDEIYHNAKAEMERCEEERKAIRAQITQLMSDATNAVIVDGESRFDVKLSLVDKKPYTVTPKPYFLFTCKRYVEKKKKTKAD